MTTDNATSDNTAGSTKTVLITGTSSGIGLAAAIGAATAGWHTIATMRDTAKATALRAAATEAGVADRVEVRQLDVTDPASVATCVDAVIATHGRLDAVVNNAGAGHLGTLEQESVDDIRAVFEVNFFGVLNVTKAALPHLRAAGGRVVTVSSIGGLVGQPFNEAYCAAKFAVEGYLEALAPVAATTGVVVTVVEPGAVASEFVNNVGFDPAMIEAAGPYAPAMRGYVEWIMGRFSTAQSAADAAAPIIEALSTDQPVFRVQTSEEARQLVSAKIADLDGSAVVGMTSTWVRASA